MHLHLVRPAAIILSIALSTSYVDPIRVDVLGLQSIVFDAKDEVAKINVNNTTSGLFISGRLLEGMFNFAPLLTGAFFVLRNI